MSEERRLQKARNDANNANAIKNAAEIASKTSNPYAKGIGTAVKVADKISGGKASEKLGKALTTANKFSPGGRILQKGLNKLGESGAGDKIANAVSKKNSGNVPNAPKGKSNTAMSNKLKNSNKSSMEIGGHGSYEAKGSVEIVKKGLALCAAFFPAIIICCVFMAASQIFVNSISLGNADSLSAPDVEDKINKKGTEGLDEEKTDDDVAYDNYISTEKSKVFINSKLRYINVKQIDSEEATDEENETIVDDNPSNDTTSNNGSFKSTYLKRKYNEADLAKIEDFYPAVVDISKNYDKNMVYDFFFKMYNLYNAYKNEYKVNLDLPLLMATLNLQSSDKYVVFSSNLSDEDRKNKARELPIEEFDYYYNWTTSNYKISSDKSNHDMELLAQHMVSKQVKEKCVDSSGNATQENIQKDAEIGVKTLTCAEGEDYKTEELGFQIDHAKYKEFLKEFLEKKYYLEGEFSVESAPAKSNNPNYTSDVTFISGGLGSNIYYYNQHDYQDYYYSKDPYNLHGWKTSTCHLGKGDCWQSISSSGCGPTSMAIVVSTLLNEPHDPIELTTKICNLGGCTQTGTIGDIFIPAASEYGLSAERTTDMQKITNAIASGNSIVIALQGPGHFTRGGHFITLTSVNENGEVYVADCSSRSRIGWWSLSTIREENRGFWIITR